MHRRLDAEEAGIENIPDSQPAPKLPGESQLASQPTVSLRTEHNRTDNAANTADTVLGTDPDFDDDSPLPDIVRYKIRSGRKGDQV